MTPLQGIVDRYAEGLAAIDIEVGERRVNQRTGELYLPGLKSMLEADVISRLDEWWWREYPHDFVSPSAHQVQIPFPGSPRNKCDQVITTEGSEDPPERAIVAKYLQLVGDNGKRNDFAVAKGLSPFLKDRSLYHDIQRLRADPIARRLAVIGFSFTYDQDSCIEALQRHPEESARIREISSVCISNGGSLSVRPIVEFADGIFRVRELVEGQFCRASFEAWRHPCGGRGVVFGWEVRREGQRSVAAAWSISTAYTQSPPMAESAAWKPPMPANRSMKVNLRAIEIELTPMLFHRGLLQP